MASVVLDMSMSLDGFIAGPHDELDRVHAWQTGAGPGRGVEVVEQMHRRAGAVVMGRRTFELGDRENNGWVADPPFDVPMYVPVHEVPDRYARQAAPTLFFVTDGVGSAVARAVAAAGDKEVVVCGASVAQQCLRSGLLDEVAIHLLPMLLGDGIRLFEAGTRPVELELVRIVDSPDVTHLRYRVVPTSVGGSGS